MTEEEILIHLRAMGVAAYTASMGEAATATEELGVASDLTGRRMETAGRRGFLMNQTLFTMRRLVYGVSIGLIAGGVAVAKWGFDFNNTMKSTRIALAPLIPDVNELNGVMSQLFQIAKYSPFTFQDTTLAFRNMYMGMRTLGISTGTVLTTMQSIIDGLSQAGRTTPAALGRISYALQHMAYLGRLTGQVVNQLGRDGVPVASILAKEFHLTGDQIHNVGKLGIPTLAFLQAFNHYMQTQPGFAGAAQRQSMRTFSGLFAQFKDNMSQIMGAVEQGFYHRTVRMMQNLNSFLSRAGAAVTGPNASVTGVLSALFPVATPGIHQLIADLRLFWSILTQIILGVTHSKSLWVTLYGALVLLHGILYLVNGTLQAFGGTLWNIVIPVMILWIGYQKLSAFWTGVNTAVTIASTKSVKELTFAQFLLAVAMGRYNLMWKAAVLIMYAYNFVTRMVIATQIIFGEVLGWLRMQMAVLFLLMELNPVFLLITAIVLLIAGLVVLYYKWTWFHNAVDKTFKYIKAHWKDLLIFIGPLGIQIRIAMFLFDKLWGKMKTIFGWIRSAVHFVQRAWHYFFGGSETGIQPTSRNLSSSGPTPFGSSINVAPLAHVRPMSIARNNFANKLTLEPAAPVELKMDGRKVAQGVAKWRLKTEGLQAGANSGR